MLRSPEIAAAISKKCVRFLQVNRQGIVETGFDAGLPQNIPDAVAILTFDDITVSYAFAIGKRRRQLVRRILELFAVASHATSTNRIPIVEPLELNGEDCCLEAVHSVVISDFIVEVSFVLRVIIPLTNIEAAQRKMECA
jgi:hypothetical protein